MDLGLLLTPLVLISVVIFVAWPLLFEKKENLPQEGTDLEIAQDDKDNVIASLKDIEMDYRMGKLSDGDYQTLREDFESRAVKAIRKLESLEEKKTLRKSRT